MAEPAGHNNTTQDNKAGRARSRRTSMSAPSTPNKLAKGHKLHPRTPFVNDTDATPQPNPQQQPHEAPQLSGDFGGERPAASPYVSNYALPSHTQDPSFDRASSTDSNLTYLANDPHISIDTPSEHSPLFPTVHQLPQIGRAHV